MPDMLASGCDTFRAAKPHTPAKEILKNNMAIIPKVYLNSVVSIGVRDDAKKIHWIGTGFFIGRNSDKEGEIVPFLVTNKHVFKGKDTVVIRMQKKGCNDLEEVDYPLLNIDKSPRYVLHDMDDIDIAVLRINAQYIINNNLEFPYIDIDNNAMSSFELRNNGAEEGSIVYMLGFPMGLVNVSSNNPISRMGCISRMTEVQINEQHNMLVDIQNFPGNSGSPIITRPEFISVGDSSSLHKSVLVGIVHSYIPYQESLINSQTKQVVEIRSENSGIANVHPVEYIRDIIDNIYPIPNTTAEQQPNT